ncbi:MAG: hypothetical protein HY052_07410 [Proteobacteria bacterium]|nr:hypothetical protein [Pseudomonadota bacterium]
MSDNMGLMETIFSYDRFMPHGYCLIWEPVLVWMHVISDLTITIAYYSIPLTILYLVVKRRERIPYRWVFLMFAIFIFLCGTTHLMGIITLWYPVYYLQGLIKVLTAAVSIATALLIFPLVPTLLEQFQQLEQKGINPWQKKRPESRDHSE